MAEKQQFWVWSDTGKRGTFAQNMKTGEIKQIKGSGYITNDLTIRKEIANRFSVEGGSRNVVASKTSTMMSGVGGTEYPAVVQDKLREVSRGTGGTSTSRT